MADLLGALRADCGLEEMGLVAEASTPAIAIAGGFPTLADCESLTGADPGARLT